MIFYSMTDSFHAFMNMTNGSKWCKFVILWFNAACFETDITVSVPVSVFEDRFQADYIKPLK